MDPEFSPNSAILRCPNSSDCRNAEFVMNFKMRVLGPCKRLTAKSVERVRDGRVRKKINPNFQFGT